MSRYGRSAEEIDLDVAYAVGEGMDVLEYLRQQHHARGWNGR